MYFSIPAELVAVQAHPTIWQVTLGEPNPITPELSTEELQQTAGLRLHPSCDNRAHGVDIAFSGGPV